MTPATFKKFALFAAKASITVILIWLVVRNIDLADTVQRVRSIPLWVVPVTLALIFIQFATGIWRWRIIIAQFGESLPVRQAVRYFVEGQFFNQALPSTVGGDGVRMFRVFRGGLRLETAVNGVILDRVVGLASLILLVALAQPLFYDRIDDPAARWAFTGIFAAATAAIIGLLFMARLPEKWHRWAVVRGIVALSRAARQAFLRPAVLAPVVAVSLIGHTLVIGVFFSIAMGLGLAVTFVDCFTLVPAVLLLATVPISIAGWGLREGAMVAAFSLIGVPGGGAAALSILFGLALVLASLPGGLLWLMSAERPVGDIETTPEKESHPVQP
ncbi:MAG: flippase-like domain-containing protein [Alphaproteobacteria bacterium]|nr:flippase-like domain-containing protein [Alphaproteobacteria bacterium]